MSRQGSAPERQDALARARAHSPFLREALNGRFDIGETFLEGGALSAAELALSERCENFETELRRQRLGLALATALGDLCAELGLEQVTGLLSDFADAAIDRAVKEAIIERVPDAEPTGFAVIAMGK